MTQLRLLIPIAALAAAFLFGVLVESWRMGEQRAEVERDLALAVQDADAAERETEQWRQKASDIAAQAVVTELELERARSRVVTKEVIRYVESPDAGQCDLPDGWVRAHDAAAGGNVRSDSRATAGADGKTTAVTDVEALITVTDNYQGCREQARRLEGWQRWYREVFDAD